MTKVNEEINGDKYYVYRHIRNDKNQPFYIGIATRCASNKTFDKIYKRAFSKIGRNDYWNNIVNKTGYSVDIIYTTNNREELCKKEVEFIQLYGRECDGSGTLCNLTNGGDYNYNTSGRSWDKRMSTIISNGVYNDMINRMKEYGRRMRGKTGIKSQVRKDRFVYDTNGVFFKHFFTQTECEKELGVVNSTIYKYIDSRTNAGKYIIKSTFCGNKIDVSDYRIVANRRMGNTYAKRIKCIVTDTNTGAVFVFDSTTEASFFLGYSNRNSLSNMLAKNNILYKKHYKIERK